MGGGGRGPRWDPPAQARRSPALPTATRVPLPQRRVAARTWTPNAPAHLEPGATGPSAPRPPPRSAYLNAQSGSRASRPGAPDPFRLLKSFWNSVGAMLATAGPGSLLGALPRPPLLEPPCHPHGRLSHMTEISHFKRPRRAGRGARRGRLSLAGSAPRHVAARGAGGQVGAWGGAGAHRLGSRLPHVAAHGAGRARKLEATRGRAGRGGAGRDGSRGEGKPSRGFSEAPAVARGGRRGVCSAEASAPLTLGPRERGFEEPGGHPSLFALTSAAAASHLHPTPGGVSPWPAVQRRLHLEPRTRARSRPVWTRSSTARGCLVGSDGGACPDTRRRQDRKLPLIMQIKSEISSGLITGCIFSFYLEHYFFPQRGGGVLKLPL